MRLLFLLMLCSISAMAQTTYVGFIDKYPVTIALIPTESDDVVEAICVYDKYDTPMIINGAKKGNKVTLYEKDAKGNINARLVFPLYKSSFKQITGEWINKDSTKRMAIHLTKDFDYANSPTPEYRREMIQSTSLKDHYLKLIVVKQKDFGTPMVAGVNVYEKKTDKLIQTLEFDAQLNGLNNTDVGDYNFDGQQDFSVFQEQFAGANTSSLYFLRDPAAIKWNDSKWEGTSFEFDAKTKTVSSSNSCCAGESIQKTTYKVTNNQLTTISSECFTWNEKKQAHVKIKCE